MRTLDPVATAQAALNRTAQLLRVLDREHTPAELYTHLRGVRHEMESAQAALSVLGNDIPAPCAGSARSGDPETSQAAARAIRTRSGSQRHDVLTFLSNRRDKGAADFEIIRGLVMVESSARTRRHELQQAGYVRARSVPITTDGTERAVVTRTRPETGLECIVWEITLAGVIALDKLNSGQMVMALVDGELSGEPEPAPVEF